MHRDEIEIDDRLRDRSFLHRRRTSPSCHWGRSTSAARITAIFRLGHGLVLRMPRIHWAAEQVRVMHRAEVVPNSGGPPT